MKSIEVIIIGLVFVFLQSCETSAYNSAVKKELASGKVYDSLFLNFKFGDTRQEFFDKGWEQNKKNLIAQGPRNKNIQYMLKTRVPKSSPIQMLFYPDFDKNNRIRKMDLSFSYSGWAPWNRRFYSDSLLVAMRDTLMNWYGGNDFIAVDLSQKSGDKVWAKVDGNRLITLKIQDEKIVEGYIKNLIHPDYKK